MVKKVQLLVCLALSHFISSVTVAENIEWVGYEITCGDHWLGMSVEVLDVYTSYAYVSGDMGVSQSGEASFLAANSLDNNSVDFTFHMLGQNAGTTLNVTFEKNSPVGYGTIWLNGSDVDYQTNCYLSAPLVD